MAVILTSSRGPCLPYCRSPPFPHFLARSRFSIHMVLATGPRLDIETSQASETKTNRLPQRPEISGVAEGVACSLFKRRGGDSNPRYPFEYTAFPVLHNRPLCHLSEPYFNRFFYSFEYTKDSVDTPVDTPYTGIRPEQAKVTPPGCYRRVSVTPPQALSLR